MASLVFKNNRFIFEDTGGERVLLDCADLLANKSRISMHRLPGQPHPIIPELLAGAIQKQREENSRFELPFGVLDALLISRLIRSSGPVRLLEYGSGQGELSVHLARLLGAFHEKSSLVCAYDTIELEWMERISLIEETLPAISFLACDFGESGLRERSFDMVVLNGLAGFPQPHDVLKDAVSLVKPGGTLFCLCDDAPLLESVFKLFFETREEYRITPFCSVMVAGASQSSWQEADAPDLAAKAREDLARTAEMLEGGPLKREECAELLEQLKKDVRAAVEQGETELKIQLLAEKERLLTRFIQS